MRKFALRTKLEPPLGNHRLQTLGHDRQRRDRILRFFSPARKGRIVPVVSILRGQKKTHPNPEIPIRTEKNMTARDVTGFYVFFLHVLGRLNLEKREKYPLSVWRKFKNPVETAPRNADICPLSWSDAS